MIFTWNGERFQFITDVLGVAPLGASSGDGRTFPVDHDEYVSIPGEMLRKRATAPTKSASPRNCARSPTSTRSSCMALDHPAGTDIVTNEKFKSPPFPEFRLFGVERRIYPVAGARPAGRDVLPALLQRDPEYPDSFRRDAAGVAELHTLDLDFGKAAPGNRAVLILKAGWIGPTAARSSPPRRNATRSGVPVPAGEGRAGHWKTVIEDMGIPRASRRPWRWI